MITQIKKLHNKNNLMKLIICFFAISALTASAQKITITPKFGEDMYHLHLSTNIRNEGVSEKTIGGFTGGAAFTFRLGRIFSFQPEIMYVTRGISQTDVFTFPNTNIVNGSITSNATLSYLEIPLLLKATYKSDKLRVFVNAGPSFSCGLGGHYKNSAAGITSNAGNTSGTIFFDYPPSNYNGSSLYFSNTNYDRWDLLFEAGGGVGYDIGPGTLLLDIRYGIGFVNFETKENMNTYYAFSTNSPTSANNTSKYRISSFTIGYALPLVK